ncbi:MAG: molybdopterin molybdotransferase MoeA [Pelovirga sp.]
MISYQQAVADICHTIKRLPPQRVLLAAGLGRVLAEDIYANLDLPPRDNSAMDGYAFTSAGITDGSLEEVGFIPAGHHFTTAIQPGQAVRIMTGAPLPNGADTVVPIEDTEQISGNRIRLRKQLQPGANVRYRGEEFKTGEKIMSCGQQLDPAAIGMLASAGVAETTVYPAPQVAILSTGDELVELGETPDNGRIINSNAHLLAACLRQDGFTPIPLGIAKDQPGELEACLRTGLDADMLITTGGVSVGDRDLVQPTLIKMGFNKIFWQVATKPGKPTLFGTIDTKPVFGLPGNPAASAATYQLYARPALRMLAGHSQPFSPTLKVTLGAPIKAGGKRLHFLWGNLNIVAGELQFLPSQRQGSGQNRSAVGAQALFPLPIDSPPLATGDSIDVIMLNLPPGQNPSNY